VTARAEVWIARADRLSLAGMALGLALMLLGASPWAFRAGFFVVLVATVAQIVFGHLRSDA
jgi:hypothetical protein